MIAQAMVDVLKENVFVILVLQEVTVLQENV
jgi:hypothetical protein